MPEPSVVHSTFVIERSYPKPPERVFAALSDPGQKRRWYARTETDQGAHFEMDFQVGGNERLKYCMSNSSPLPGAVLRNDGTYQDILPNRRIVLASAMSLGEKRISASLITFELLATETGTDLIFTHQGAFFEGADGPEMREAGWRGLLNQFDAELMRQ